MTDCTKCLRTDVKCCFTCKKDADKCKVWHHCGSDCPEHESRIKTNADRIRSMSDEELAEFLCDISKCESGYCPAYDTCMETEHGTMKKWLQSEAE